MKVGNKNNEEIPIKILLIGVITLEIGHIYLLINCLIFRF
ncbi:hypothetical protein XBFM1_2420010 [Xenorhabdus bovienii str. feltiae Moldova]|uniref:Uncharacterized protein n=1 Tax=Xenorhabdus bovienii str. feltiae Moldova TaxID=1398200 RepID=A0A077NSX4_XENBV|nr:hypothetical protein XBFM1_2420010 [Xenorhabdus bovienii str. feltiae Moldova]